MQEFNNFENQIPQEVFTKEQDRWGTIPGHDLNQIKEFLTQRTPVVDELMNSFYPPKNYNGYYILGCIAIILLASSLIIVKYRRKNSEQNKAKKD